MLSSNFTEMTTSTSFRKLLHSANLRHVTDGFNSPLKGGTHAKNFFAFKNPMASAGYERADYGTKAQPTTPIPSKP
jgi:hypothetical protein